MMIISGILSSIGEKLGISDFNSFITNLIFSAGYLVAGIALGMLIGFVLKKFISKAELEKATEKSFISLFSVAIRWSIYILFLSLALEQLGIPQLTSWLTSILVVIPALVGALILIGVGFAIATYLKSVIKESSILNKEALSMILFYFVNYVFLVYAIKTALISLDKNSINIVIVILTAVISVALACYHLKHKK